MILSAASRRAVDELVEEQQRADLLRAHGLEPRHRIRLVGPPGTGKTSLAEAIAEAVMVPLFAVRYESMIGRSRPIGRPLVSTTA
jgi:SpoVK/Ycf46/Vps4 family AAA+-type ATPase